MPVDGNTILLSYSFQEVACHPYLVACFFSTLGEDLELPPSCCHFGIDPFYIESSVETGIKMFFNDGTAIGIGSAYRAIIRTLWSGEPAFRETKWFIVFRIPEEVFLLETKPEV